MPPLARGATAVIDVKCPLCREVYHAEPAHVGKYIKCSRCGSMVPILEGLNAVAPRPAHVVRPQAARPKRSPTPHRATWAIAAFSTFALIAFALIWSHFGNKSTVDSTEPPGLGKVAQNASDAATSNARKASGEFEVADLDPDPSSVLPAVGTDVAPRREPEPRPNAYHSLSTGARFCRGKITTTGEGALTVENGTAEDAALRLYDVSTEQTIRCLFVKANESVRITGISEGTYGLKYTTGLDWQDNMETFRWRPLYSRFEKQFPYSEERIGNEIQYHDIRVTLHPVVGGNVRTISISREEFLRGNQD